MTRNKKIFILGIGTIVTLLVLVFTTNLKYSFCSDHYTVDCWQEPKQESKPITITKEGIPCSNNRDCFIALKLESFCSPGHANLLKCVGARYYCGDDGYCKGCVCPWFSPGYWLSAD